LKIADVHKSNKIAIAELEMFELERKAKEVEAILRYRQSLLNNLLQPYQQQN
jgi:hypothetical protein